MVFKLCLGFAVGQLESSKLILLAKIRIKIHTISFTRDMIVCLDYMPLHHKKVRSPLSFFLFIYLWLWILQILFCL